MKTSFFHFVLATLFMTFFVMSDLVDAGDTSTAEQYSLEGLFSKDYSRFDASTRADNSEQNFLLAQSTEKDDEEPMSPECAAFAKDPHADLGEVLRAGCEPTLAQMSRLMDNPLGNVAMWINQLDVYQLENDAFPGTSESKTVYMGILQFPKGISENWNIINRIVYSIVSTPIEKENAPNLADFASQPVPPSGFTGAPIDVLKGRTTGFGDLYYVGLFSPKEAIKHEGGGRSVWGVGFDAGFPTASDDVLGTGKWTAGPAALYAYLGPTWKAGALVQQYWDYAEDKKDSPDVNLMNLQYFVFYSVTDTFSIGATPNIIANWDQDSDNTWTVPIGLGFHSTTQFGKVPVRFGAEVHYSIVTPDSIPAPKWDFRFIIAPAVPSALFKWLD